MMEPHPRKRTGWRDAAAFLLAVCTIPLWIGCGDREKAAVSSAPDLPEGGSPPQIVSAGSGTSEGGAVPVAGADVSVFVVPSSPTRISPPTVSVAAGSGPGAELLGIRWMVNDSERGEGRVLSASEFQRGDRIRAVVALRTGGGAREIATPEVVAGNALPAVESVTFDPRVPAAGSRIRAIVSAADPDGDPLTFRYEWYLDNVSVPGDGDALDLKKARRGSFVHVRVTPNDGIADGAWRHSPVHEIGNASPVVRSKPPESIPPSRVLIHRIVAEDPDGDRLTYTLERGPKGMSLDGSTLTWKVSDEEIGNPAEVAVRISDSNGGETLLTMTLTPRMP